MYSKKNQISKQEPLFWLQINLSCSFGDFWSPKHRWRERESVIVAWWWKTRWRHLIKPWIRIFACLKVANNRAFYFQFGLFFNLKARNLFWGETWLLGWKLCFMFVSFWFLFFFVNQKVNLIEPRIVLLSPSRSLL